MCVLCPSLIRRYGYCTCCKKLKSPYPPSGAHQYYPFICMECDLTTPWNKMHLLSVGWTPSKLIRKEAIIE